MKSKEKLVLSSLDVDNVFQLLKNTKNFTKDEIEQFLKKRALNKFNVSDLKIIAKYVNEVKLQHKSPYHRIRLKGNKDALIQSISSYLYKNEPNRSFSLESLGLQDSSLVEISTLSDGNVVTQSMKRQTAGREKNFTERRYFEKLESDLTNSGAQNPFYAIQMVLDMILVKKGKLKIPLSIPDLEYNQLRQKSFELHFYWLKPETLAPQNWNRKESKIKVNSHPLTLPNENSFLKKKLKKVKVITSIPLKVPKDIIRQENQLVIDHPPWLPVEAVLAVCIVRIFSEEELMQMVEDRPHTTTKTFREKTRIDQDLEEFETEVISIEDAVTRVRIETPVKGKNCTHKSCFDLASYLTFGLESNLWNCPICEQPAPFDDLHVDDMIKAILEKVGDDDVDKVKLLEDGSFELIYPESHPMHQDNKNEELVKNESTDQENLIMLDSDHESISYDPGSANMPICLD